MGLAKIDSGTGDQRSKPVPVKNITFGVFFDGTGNNMYNTDAREAANKIKDPKAEKNTDYEKHTDHENSSYENSYSNVARLYTNYQPNKYPDHYRLYVEGIGTLKEHSDDMLDGTALGRYEHGIISRVIEGCKNMAIKLKSVVKPNAAGKKEIATLTIDVFGFSRGSAAARYFIHEITKAPYKSTHRYVSDGDSGIAIARDDKKIDTEFEEFPLRGYLGAYCQQGGIIIDNLVVRFVGIFDTVASYSEGIIYSSALKTDLTDTPAAFQDDTKELFLDAVSRARRVVHLTAGDEHRANFPLTNINSAKTRGTELSLPGVHSDVGGCYEAGKPENIERLMQVYDYNAVHPIDNTINSIKTFFHDPLKDEANRLINEGWYKKDELSTHTAYGGGLLATQYCLAGKRAALPKSYSFIPLHIMGKFAVDYDTKFPIPFDLAELENGAKTSVTGFPLLVRIKERIKNYAFHGGKPVQLHYDPAPVNLNQPVVAQADATRVQKPVMMPAGNTKPAVHEDTAENIDLKNLRHSYLHFSAKYDRGAMRIIPNYPRLVHGKRERLILPG